MENGRQDNHPIEEIMPPKSSYFKVPYTEKMKQTSYKRDGVPIKEEIEKSHSFIKDLWLEKFGG
jgi:hypothetical protein